MICEWCGKRKAQEGRQHTRRDFPTCQKCDEALALGWRTEILRNRGLSQAEIDELHEQMRRAPE